MQTDHENYGNLQAIAGSLLGSKILPVCGSEFRKLSHGAALHGRMHVKELAQLNGSRNFDISNERCVLLGERKSEWSKRETGRDENAVIIR